MGWGGRWQGGTGWGTHVTTWLIRVSVWQEPLQYCKLISLHIIKINEKKRGNFPQSGFEITPFRLCLDGTQQPTVPYPVVHLSVTQ